MQAEKLCEIFAEPLQVMQVLISSVGGALIAQMFGISFGNRSLTLRCIHSNNVSYKNKAVATRLPS